MKPHIHKHFKSQDPILFAALQKFESSISEIVPRHASDYFSDLCDAIISQQLSVKAGATIFTRFKGLFPRGIITPEKTLKLKDEQIRGIGASWSKVRYIKDLAFHVVEKKIVFEKLNNMSDEEAIKTLTAIKGIGPWTAEMFLISGLGREDVFSYGDLGLMRGIQKLYGFKKDPTRKQMEKIVKKWMPYRTYASRILWRSLDM
jgi:DNA-3-methyladenine glycosylase II